MASVFTLIMNKDLPGHFVWEDERCVAIMTIQPIRTGHLLVIPREEIDQWSDLPVDLATHLMQVSHKLANAMKKLFPAKRIGLMIAGLEVPHTHIHLVPMDSMDDLDFANIKNAESAALGITAAAIREVLKSDS